eukprot:SAG22_NODE_1383_length_4542_cov_2.418636_5_plen_192_part_00
MPFPAVCLSLALFALLNNLTEMRVDGIAYTHLSRRPRYRDIDDIGAWEWIIQSVSGVQTDRPPTLDAITDHPPTLDAITDHPPTLDAIEIATTVCLQLPNEHYLVQVSWIAVLTNACLVGFVGTTLTEDLAASGWIPLQVMMVAAVGRPTAIEIPNVCLQLLDTCLFCCCARCRSSPASRPTSRSGTRTGA